MISTNLKNAFNVKGSVLIVIVCMLFVSSTSLKSQDTESNKEYKKSYIGVGVISTFPGNSNYSEDNWGINLSYKSKNKFLWMLNYMDVGYVNYKSENDPMKKQNYSVSVGVFSIFTPNKDRDFISYYFGLNYGVLYKKDEEKSYALFGINSGFILKVYKNINFEIMLKTKYNKSDEFYTEGQLGLSYLF